MSNFLNKSHQKKKIYTQSFQLTSVQKKEEIMAASRNVPLAVTIFIAACNVTPSAEQDRESKIQDAMRNLQVIEEMISKAEEEQSQIISRMNYIKSDSPIISYCVINDLFTNGLLVAVFSKNENEKLAGQLSAVGCGLAMLHEEYDSIKMEIESINNKASKLEKDIFQLSISKGQAQSELRALQNETP
jgi:hypothetical protein